MTREGGTTATTRRRAADVDAILAASRVLVAVSAQSIESVEDIVTLTQLRALVTIASHDSLNLAGLANALNVHPSSATRVCDRLVAAGLLDRRDAVEDRRHLNLALTSKGRMLVDTVMDDRRVKIEAIMRRIPERRRREVVAAFGVFAAAAHEFDPSDLWALGWQS